MTKLCNAFRPKSVEFKVSSFLVTNGEGHLESLATFKDGFIVS